MHGAPAYSLFDVLQILYEQYEDLPIEHLIFGLLSPASKGFAKKVISDKGLVRKIGGSCEFIGFDLSLRLVKLPALGRTEIDSSKILAGNYGVPCPINGTTNHLTQKLLHRRWHSFWSTAKAAEALLMLMSQEVV